MDETQLLKGILEGCILSIISEKETYGYEILSQLEDTGFKNLKEGTLYPLLSRLDNKKLIKCRKAKSPFGPIRKYYSITESGERKLNEFKNTYFEITDSASKILNKKKN